MCHPQDAKIDDTTKRTGPFLHQEKPSLRQDELKTRHHLNLRKRPASEGGPYESACAVRESRRCCLPKRVLGGSAAGGADYELAVEENVSREHVWMLDAVQHRGHGSLPDFAAGLMNGRQRHG